MIGKVNHQATCCRPQNTVGICLFHGVSHLHNLIGENIALGADIVLLSLPLHNAATLATLIVESGIVVIEILTNAMNTGCRSPIRSNVIFFGQW